MSYFIEDSDAPFMLQIDNFAQKLPAYATLLGFTPAEVSEAQADASFFGSILTADNMVEKYAHDYKHFKHLLRHGSKTEVITAPPAPLVLDPFPTTVAANVQNRFAKKAAKAKASTNYTSAIGQELGIAAVKPSFDVAAGKPDLKVVLNAGYPEINFHKLKYSAANLYKDSGSGYGNLPFKTLHAGHYRDMSPLPAAGVAQQLKYKMIYVYHDDEVGNWSDEVSVTVAGSI